MAGKCLVVLMVLSIGFFLPAEAVSKNPEDEIREMIARRQQAYKSEDYQYIWERWSDDAKNIYFQNDIEVMKKRIKARLTSKGRADIYNAVIEQITLLGPGRAFVETTPPNPLFPEGVYLIKEGGAWKLHVLRKLVSRTRENLQIISSSIKNFYDERNKLPRDLRELSRFNPSIKENMSDDFSDRGATYRFLFTDSAWKVFSLGPDSDDDKGLKNYREEDGLMSDGDIIYTGSLQ